MLKLYLIFFFKDLEDARKFYDNLHNAVVLGSANTIDYGFCYFVSVAFSDIEVQAMGDKIGFTEWEYAKRLSSYLGNASALEPLDVWGVQEIIAQR